MAFICQERVRKQQKTQPVGVGGGGGGGGEVSPMKSVLQSACQYDDVTTRVSDFQNGEQSVHRRDG